MAALALDWLQLQSRLDAKPLLARLMHSGLGACQ
jgi:hypothetical protein